MLYNDPVYGTTELTEPVLLDLMETQAMRRARGVLQHGVSALVGVTVPTSRFDHSLGVMLLVRRLGGGLEEQIAALPLLPEGRLTIESHLRELRFFQQELSEVARQLQRLNRQAEHRTVIKSLTSVPGVGTVVATSFHLELFRPERFQRSEEVASYLGLSPTVRHSGEQTPRSSLASCGQKRLRSLLIEAAWMWRTKDAKVGEVYNKLLSKTGIAQKAITALARRLAIILWRLSIEQRPYRPV